METTRGAAGNGMTIKLIVVLAAPAVQGSAAGDELAVAVPEQIPVIVILAADSQQQLQQPGVAAGTASEGATAATGDVLDEGQQRLVAEAVERVLRADHERRQLELGGTTILTNGNGTCH